MHAKEGDALNHSASVLIVDGSDDTREVLHTALERRGWQTYSAGEPSEAAELARRHHPDLIVLDLELGGDETASLREALPPGAEGEAPRFILIGTARAAFDRGIPGRWISKPYHFAPLIRTIEESLQAIRPAASRIA